MTLKRTFFELDNDNDSPNYELDEPLVKRRVTTTQPFTPLPKRSLPTGPRTVLPRTPYPSRPLDSPTNPLGRKRTRALVRSLPPQSSFSSHLPLRFQFVRPGVSPRLGGIYRIVQVPLNYTFIQLRCLITFLFGGGYGFEREDRHLFEVKKKVSLYAHTYKPGQVRSGFTFVKLSTARDPCRYRPDADGKIFDDDSQDTTDAQEPQSESEDDAEDWAWELEEEFTVGHAWPKGGDIRTGVIYHHNETTAVHITMNTSELPSRRGISNTPYVFSARGRVRLLPNSVLPLPKPIFSVPIKSLPVPCRSDIETSVEDANDNDAEGESDPEYGDARGSMFLSPEEFQTTEEVEWGEEVLVTDDEEDEEHEDPNVMLKPSKFNTSNAFAAYLRFVYQQTQLDHHSQSDDSDSDDDFNDQTLQSTPGLVHSSSSPASSPIHSSSIGFSSPSMVYVGSAPSTASLSILSSLSAIMPTPAPRHPLWRRRRIERLERRMEKHKNRTWTDEEDKDDQGKVPVKIIKRVSRPHWRRKKIPFPEDTPELEPGVPWGMIHEEDELEV